MTKLEAMKKVIELLNNDETYKEATEIAREHEIALTEIWSDDEIIGIAVEDEVVYFN